MAVTVPKAVLVGGSSALSRHIKPLTRQWRVGNYAKEMLDGGGRETLLDDVGICTSFRANGYYGIALDWSVLVRHGRGNAAEAVETIQISGRCKSP